MNKKPAISNETQTEAMRVAKATQKAGQTKEQTRLIAQGIEKGIAEYKKQQKAKARERDKARKQELRQKKKLQHNEDEGVEASELPSSHIPKWQLLLPWTLLILSWIWFIFI
ncbi:DUF2956 domain-containing protein [Shewanella chilikensis]|uniref:DUF2956 domain-containing protein n=1 Tax=Shewanella chilikensis TaxID=558541 RepID=UPI001F396500|nr:DUF2956 domain-containing protein [Shewanella chilikensis]MCE9789683.1 DUF2956 domain-containing protein [Shewanella chilikensis]